MRGLELTTEQRRKSGKTIACKEHRTPENKPIEQITKTLLFITLHTYSLLSLTLGVGGKGGSGRGGGGGHRGAQGGRGHGGGSRMPSDTSKGL